MEGMGSGAMAGEGDYVYLTVKDAKSAINQRVSLLAAVVHRGPFEPSRQSAGILPAFACPTLVMFDLGFSTFFSPTSFLSYFGNELVFFGKYNGGFGNDDKKAGLTVAAGLCLFGSWMTRFIKSFPVRFFGTKSMLPLVQSDGDIIRLRHVMIRCCDGKVFAIFKKEISSFALFKGDDYEDIKAYQESKPSSSVTVQDKGFIRQLQTWLTKNLILAGLVENVLPLNEIQKCGCCSLVCKILHFSEFNRDYWILYVWDGTDCPILTFKTNPNLEGEEQYPLQLEPVPLSRSILGLFPPVGSVLRIIADQPYKHLCGKWVQLLRIIYQVKCGLWFGELRASSELVPLSNEDDIVISRQRRYEVRQSHNLNRLPQAWFHMPSRITDTAKNNTPFSTLMDVLTHSEVTCEYKCVARVITAHPWEIERLISPRSGKYRIRFTLEDPTARIRAGLFDEDGEKFFGGYLPKHGLTRKMNILLGVSDGLSPRNPPWIELCLISFYTNKSDKWGSRKYRIINTTLSV